mgnify:CR=1 FL=1
MAKNKSKIVYLCSSCGQDFPKWNGQCPSCNEWGTLSEYKVQNKKSSRLNGEKKETHTLEDILLKEEGGMKERFDKEFELVEALKEID